MIEEYKTSTQAVGNQKKYPSYDGLAAASITLWVNIWIIYNSLFSFIHVWMYTSIFNDIHYISM